MLGSKFKASAPKKEIIYVKNSKWIRAKASGMFRAAVKLNAHVEKDTILGYITDAYGKFNRSIKTKIKI